MLEGDCDKNMLGGLGRCRHTGMLVGRLGSVPATRSFLLDSRHSEETRIHRDAQAPSSARLNRLFEVLLVASHHPAPHTMLHAPHLPPNTLGNETHSSHR